MLLPLIRRRQNNIVIVEFADLDLTDYNAPILGAAAPRDARAARALWRSLLSALRRMPEAADLVRLRKLPVDLDGKPNPLALLGAAGPCSLNGNLVTAGEDYDAWRYTLEKTVRKELERSWRVFTREPAASFAIITDASEALRILSATEVQQGTRMQSLGLNYILRELRGVLPQPGARRRRQGLCAGLGAHGRRRDRGDAARHQDRLTLRDDPHQQCRREMVELLAGPADHRAHHGGLHKDGVREFDFSVGNYAYKRRFGVRRLPLIDISAALSWRGWPFALRDRAVGTLRNHPQLDTSLRRVFGKPLSHEEN